MKRLAHILVMIAALLLLSSSVYAATEARRKEKVQEPVIEFNHRYADIHLTMKLSKLKTLNKLLPANLRREVGDEYYPEIRRQLATKDSMSFKEGEASIERFPAGKIKLTLSFPNFVMVIREATWEQIDEVFAEYF
ncbi:MAG: hypothetical protein J5533_05325 [Bacteroidales bacterium]|nr:hypothetical protein [Bacteroidales bacterium]